MNKEIMKQLEIIEKKLDKIEKKLDNHIEDVWLVYKPIKKINLIQQYHCCKYFQR